MKYIVILILPAMLASCSRYRGTPMIEKRTFEALYAELLDSAAVHQPGESDSTVSPGAQRILQRHGITIEQFKGTVAAYNTDTQKWKEFYENVLKKYDERSKRASP